MTFYESNPEIGPTGAEAGEFVDDGPLSGNDDAQADPSRRPTGAPPLQDDDQDDDPGHRAGA
jgi:hypothetical protein